MDLKNAGNEGGVPNQGRVALALVESGGSGASAEAGTAVATDSTTAISPR
jgi:hypothetical protein